MSFISRALLLAGGAVAGYLVSRSTGGSAFPSRDLELKQGSTLERLVGQEGKMAKFFDSKVGSPFKASALSVLRFSAKVKAGMNEKEEELKERFESQKQAPRPGSLDDWERISYRADLDAQVLEPANPDQPTPPASSPAQANRQRLARDAQLGKDFFS